MAVLANKEQALLRAIPFAGKAALGTGLTGIVSICLDTDAPGLLGFVPDEGMQFRKGPRGRVPIGRALLQAGFLAVFPFGALPDAREVFQADESMGVRVQEMLADGVVGIQLQPSLSLADSDASPGGAASAFLLKSLLDSGVVVRLAAYFLSAIELRAIAERGNGGKIALAHVHSHDLLLVSGRGVRRFNGQGHQQVEAFVDLIIPEFGPAHDRPGLQPSDVLSMALIGENHSSSTSQDADLLAVLQGIIPRW